MFKQVIIVRSDLKLSKGKTAVQVAHASLEAYKKADKKMASEWERKGAKKVVVKVSSLKELIEIFQRLKQLGFPCALIRDAGKTEVVPGTATAVGAGPVEEEKINKITSTLKML